jgi:hypothetical protein
MNNKKELRIVLVLLLCLGFTRMHAQESKPDTLLKAQESKPDTLLKAIEQLQSDVALIKNLKITGYVQAQVQFADSAGIKTMAGGNFPTGSDQRFKVRRGRLKFVYSSSPLNQLALQIDVTEAGVKTKEVYAKFTDPFVNWFSLTGGLQNRPFGYEVEFSSGLLESPERSRMNQSLFKDEYDLGGMLTVQAPKTSRFNFIKLDAGFFSGSLENNDPMDFKKKKDFIGRLNFTKSFFEENLKLSGDLSYYNGGVPNNSRKVLKVVDNGGTPAFTGTTVDSLSNVLREYYGADVQITFVSPLGLSTLRGEFTKGQQASAASDITNPVSLAATPNLYVRKVQGFYVMFVQNILQSRHSFVIKYDVFDPNTKASGSELTTAGNAGFTASDIKYTDLGLGYLCRIDSNLKLTIYYDINKNESTHLKGFARDVKDNVWTVRLQYKF